MSLPEINEAIKSKNCVEIKAKYSKHNVSKDEIKEQVFLKKYLIYKSKYLKLKDLIKNLKK